MTICSKIRRGIPQAGNRHLLTSRRVVALRLCGRMSKDDRPFVCPEKDCGMRFTSEDHLSVHKLKHEMSLPLTPGTGKLGCLLFADQTPTPTKFLRNCDEIGLFNDIKNPFEEAFKKAAYSNSTPSSSDKCETVTLHVPTSIHSIHSPGVLNTPVPQLNSQITHTVEPEYIPLPGPDSDAGSTLDTPTPDIFKHQDTLDLDQAIDLRINDNKTTFKEKVSTPSSVFSPEPLAESQDSNVSQLSTAEKGSVIVRPSSVSTIDSPGSSVASTPVTSPKPVVMLLQIQPGVNIPVQMPAAMVGTATAPFNLMGLPQPAGVSQGVLKQEPVMVASSSAGPQLTAKQKLKAAITQNVQQSVLNNNMRVMSEAVERVTSHHVPSRPSTLLRPGTSASSLAIPHSSAGSVVYRPATMSPKVQMQAADTSTPYNKRAKKSPEEDPEDRRRKFLERNRAAAARCRQKKKARINVLEEKADDLMAVNNKLQSEVNSLRGEVAQLKSLLMAHKDCPIFAQQRMSGQLNLDMSPSPTVQTTGPPPAKKPASLMSNVVTITHAMSLVRPKSPNATSVITTTSPR